MTRKRWLSAVLLAAVSGRLAACEGLSAENGWIRQPPPGQRVAAAYVVLSNNGTSVVRITGVHSPYFESAMVHETLQLDGQARMRRLERIDLAPGDRFVAEPGGRHIMLFGPVAPLGANTTVEISFECDAGTALNVELPVSRSAPD